MKAKQAKAKAKAKSVTKKSNTKPVLKGPQAVAHYQAVARDINAGKLPKSAGEFIRALLVAGKHTMDAIVTETKRRFKGSTTAKSDVYWNRGRLKREGVKLTAMPKVETKK